jgi:hypothetical protein
MPRKKEPTQQLALSVQLIEQRIYLIRGHKVMLDQDLAELYEVETKVLNQAVKRNLARFPEDFMFQLDKAEFDSLRSQFVTSNKSKGGRRYLPYVFTEQGIAMLSSVLNSEKAIQVNIAIMRTFVQMRKLLVTNEELARRIDELEKNTNTRLKKHDDQIRAIFEAIKKLIKATIPKTTEPTRQIGFMAKDDEENR